MGIWQSYIFESLLTILNLATKDGTMNAKTEKLVRRSTMVATVTASYFLLTADYGPQPNVLDPIKEAILSGEEYVKGVIFGKKSKPDGKEGNAGSNEA